jgi:hypothetical protein
MSTHCSLVSEHCFMYLGSIIFQACRTSVPPRYKTFPLNPSQDDQYPAKEGVTRRKADFPVHHCAQPGLRGH